MKSIGEKETNLEVAIEVARKIEKGTIRMKTKEKPKGTVRNKARKISEKEKL